MAEDLMSGDVIVGDVSLGQLPHEIRLGGISWRGEDAGIERILGSLPGESQLERQQPQRLVLRQEEESSGGVGLWDRLFIDLRHKGKKRVVVVDNEQPLVGQRLVNTETF